jgi:hypothetical protein
MRGAVPPFRQYAFMAWCSVIKSTGTALCRAVSTNGNAYKFLDGKHEAEVRVGSPRCRWEDIIKMDLGEVGCEDVDWIHLAQDRDQWRTVLDRAVSICIPYLI